jgi:sugar lactone lactonase YvrE
MPEARVATLAAAIVVLLAGCAPTRPDTVLAESRLQWTGVAITDDQRLFVNFPRWYESRYRMAVAELIDGEPRPYPDDRWNRWVPGVGWRDRFVAVQSVHVDRQGRLWVLDTGQVSRDENRRAAIYQIDPETDEVVRTIECPFEIAPEGSYLNDIRLTPDGRHAFVSESGLGAIIVLDTDTGQLRRRLADHPSTKGSAEKTPVIGGEPWLIRETGEPNVVHCDGIAVTPDGEWVYYQAISADTQYRIPAAVLADPDADADANVETVGTAPVTDGMIFDDAGNLYFSALEENAVIYRTPEGEYRTLVSGPDIDWPDSFAIDRVNHRLIFTTAQIHQTPRYSHDGTWPDDPFRVWAVPLPR